MRRLALVALIFVGVSAPASANVADNPVTLAKAQAIAAKRWGPNACTGRVVVTVMSRALFDAARGDQNGVADVDSSTCTIRIARERINGPVGLCMALTHEIGHISGLGHSPNPHDVMHEIGALYPTADCLRAFIPRRVKMLRERGFRCRPSDQGWRCVKRKRSSRYVIAL